MLKPQPKGEEKARDDVLKRESSDQDFDLTARELLTCLLSQNSHCQS